jgi:hypothetical protein
MASAASKIVPLWYVPFAAWDASVDLTAPVPTVRRVSPVPLQRARLKCIWPPGHSCH